MSNIVIIHFLLHNTYYVLIINSSFIYVQDKNGTLLHHRRLITFLNKTLIENIKKRIETKTKQKSKKEMVDSLVNIVVMLILLRCFFL